MEETPRETWAIWVGVAFTAIPSMIASGFMSDWNVLPFAGWVAIATVGSAVAGIVATPLFVRGAISGALTGFGMIMGTWLYVVFRTLIIDSSTFWNIELVIGGFLGAAPGMMLYSAWVRSPSD